MPSLEESENGVVQFQWGKRRGVGNANKDVQFYESFIYDEESYSLYDNVYLFKEGDSEPYVGKILKIWEQPGHKRRVKILWFFRPSDINVYLDGHASSEKELFLAAGEGIGLYNVNPLEAIAGKCFVICTSCDERNPKPSNVAIENADFVFSRFFDVGTCTILERPPETIAGVELKFLLNNPEDQKQELIKLESVDPGVFDEKPIKQPSARTDSAKLPSVTQNDSDILIRKPKIKPEVDAVKPVDNNIQRKVRPVDGIIKQAHDGQEKSESTTRKWKYVSDEDAPNNDSVVLPKVSSSLVELDAVKPVDNNIRRKVRPVDSIIKHAHDDQKKSESSTRKRKYVSDEDTPNNDSVLLPKISSSLVELAEAKNNTLDALPPKPSSAALYRSRWFADMPWKARLEKAHKQGKLLFLDNLDPSYSSSEIEEFLLEALKIECNVKLIPQVTFHNPHYGQAYAICNTKDEANSAVQQIDEKCLILSDGRPVCAKLGMLDLPQKAAKFPGHLKIDKGRLQSARIEHKQAVATSHCSQPNTIEFELALDWLLILHKYQRCKEKLFKKHRGQLQAFLSKYTGK